MSIRNLDSLFKPSSIAIIGASSSPEKIGGLPVAYLKASGFAYVSDVELSDGTTVVADGEYLFESIRDPAARIVTGFSGAR